MSELSVKLKVTRNMSAPAYATPGSAAVDLRAALDEETVVTILPGERALIPTGLFIAPESQDCVAIVCARSGLACKNGINLSNGIGVIDSDYRGEICVSLQNNSKVPFEVRRNDRIAQMMFMPVCHASFLQVDELDETERGAGGFGSTGVK